MPTSNPALSEKAFQRQLTPAELDARMAATEAAYAAPAYEKMTVNGAITATAVLLALLLVGAAVGWSTVTVTDGVVSSLPPLLFPAVLVGLGLALVTIFKPTVARVTGPIYALVEGYVLGAISHVYDTAYDGIVLQALGLTAGVFVVLLALYRLRIIQVTEKLRTGIIVATGAIFLVYLVSFVLRLVGVGDVPFLHDSGPMGIGISLVIVGVAAANLLLDFDFVERGVQQGLPARTEWYAAFGLVLTLVWLYLELLRLLAKLRD